MVCMDPSKTKLDITKTYTSDNLWSSKTQDKYGAFINTKRVNDKPDSYVGLDNFYFYQVNCVQDNKIIVDAHLGSTTTNEKGALYVIDKSTYEKKVIKPDYEGENVYVYNSQKVCDDFYSICPRDIFTEKDGEYLPEKTYIYKLDINNLKATKIGYVDIYMTDTVVETNQQGKMINITLDSILEEYKK